MNLAHRRSAMAVAAAPRCCPRCGAIPATGRRGWRRASALRWLARAGGSAGAAVGLIALPTSDGVILIAVATVAPLLALCWIINDNSRTRRLTRLVRELRANR